MQYSTLVERDESGVKQLFSSIRQFSEGGFIASIQDRNLNEYDIMSYTNSVKSQYLILEREFIRMKQFSDTFNNSFATDNNQYFDAAYQAFGKMRSSLAATRRVLLKFTKNKPDTYRLGQRDTSRTPSVYKNAPLMGASYQMDAFGMASYENPVKELYDAMTLFFNTLRRMLQLSLRMILDERAIKNDPIRCAYIYNTCFEKVARKIAEFLALNGVNANQNMEEDPLSSSKRTSFPLNSFAQKNFHQHTTKEFNQHVLYELQKEGAKRGLSPIEQSLWPIRQDCVKDIRFVIAHFDELPDVEGRKGKLSSLAVANFCLWCDVNNRRKLVKYFNQQYSGQYDTVSDAAVCSAIKENSLTKESNIYIDFVKELETVLARKIPQASANSSFIVTAYA